mgnify:CR=1 FL=1
MKKFNEWCDRMDEKLKDFNFQDFLYILFPISMFFKRKQKETSKNIVYNVRHGKPIIVQSQKILDTNLTNTNISVSGNTN